MLFLLLCGIQIVLSLGFGDLSRFKVKVGEYPSLASMIQQLETRGVADKDCELRVIFFLRMG